MPNLFDRVSAYLAQKRDELAQTTVKDVAQGANRGFVTGVLGAPVDIANTVMAGAGGPAPVGGSEWIGNKLQGLGMMSPPPQNIGGEAASFAGGMVNPSMPAALMGKLLAAGKGVGLAQILFHGSPYKFDKFDSAKIGTGEGAQAYSYGHYLAENPGVAQTYQTSLAENVGYDHIDALLRKHYGVNRSADEVRELLAKSPTLAPLADNASAVQALKDLLPGYRPNLPVSSESLNSYRQLNDAIQQQYKGYLYKVDVPDEHIARMMDWDKPLGQQAPNVQRAFGADLRAQKAAYLGSLSHEGRRIAKTMLDDVPDNLTNGTHDANWAALMRADPNVNHNAIHDINAMAENMGTGADIERMLGGGKDAAQKLLEMGIPGMKYLDGGSRKAGDGTRNFVVYDDAIPKILSRE